MFPADIGFAETCHNGILELLTGICGFNPVADRQLINRAEELDNKYTEYILRIFSIYPGSFQE